MLNHLSQKVALYLLVIIDSPSSRTVFRLKDLPAGKALNTLASTSSDDNNTSQVEKDIDKLSSTFGTNLEKPFYKSVISTSLDDFLDQNNLEYNFKNFGNISLKIDVDGLDFLVLAGALQSLSGISILLLSICPKKLRCILLCQIWSRNMVLKLFREQM